MPPMATATWADALARAADAVSACVEAWTCALLSVDDSSMVRKDRRATGARRPGPPRPARGRRLEGIAARWPDDRRADAQREVERGSPGPCPSAAT